MRVYLIYSPIMIFVVNVCYICCGCDDNDYVCDIETQDDWVVMQL